MSGPSAPSGLAASVPLSCHRRPSVIVTRPADEAGHWVDVLQAHGWSAQALPLIQIGPPHDPVVLQTLQTWRGQWRQVDALFFVSGAAVQYFFDGGDTAAPADGPRFWAPGPGTARALMACGVDPRRIDSPAADAAQFDSESLWAVVSQQVRAGHRILIVRGNSLVSGDVTPEGRPDKPADTGSGRDWMIRQCRDRGAEVSLCVAYERRHPNFTVDDLALIHRASDSGHVWLFSSSEALANLERAVPAQVWSESHALVTHPRIADAARATGFGHVVETRPALPDVLRALESEWSKP